MSYKIFTDSSAGLKEEQIKSNDISIIPLSYFIDDVEYIGYQDGKPTDLKAFYDMMRTKARVSTACINETLCYDEFKKQLEFGRDIFYVGFSSGLSANYNSASTALEKLKLEYPNQKIYYVDSLCASFGQGLLAITACEKRDAGMSIEDLKEYIESVKLKLNHLFTVDDLFYLFRGGRVSKANYTLGNLLKIKPVLRVDDNGKLVPLGKVMSRKKSILDIADRLSKAIVNPEEQTIFVVHGDCEEDADLLIKKVSELVQCKGFVKTMLDPVIGTHSGPGTIAIFFYGEHS